MHPRISGLQTREALVASKLADLNSRESASKEALAKAMADLESRENQLTSKMADVEARETRLAHRGKVAAAEARAARLSDKIADIESREALMAERTVHFQTLEAELTSKAADLESQEATLEGRASALNAANEALNKDRRAVEDQRVGIWVARCTAAEEISALQKLKALQMTSQIGPGLCRLLPMTWTPFHRRRSSLASWACGGSTMSLVSLPSGTLTSAVRTTLCGLDLPTHGIASARSSPQHRSESCRTGNVSCTTRPPACV